MAVCVDTHPSSPSFDLTSTQEVAISLSATVAAVAIAIARDEPCAPTEIDILADKIVDLITGFLYLKSPDDQFRAVGRYALRKTVYRYIERNEQMELVFPGFPFKSPSEKKVLGRLPDLGEELLLRRLEDLARTIDEHHAAGAVVRIVSDGIVYGEILGRDDRFVYQYNETLRKMTIDHGLSHITFVRVVDLLDPTCGLSFSIMTEDEYASSIPEVRKRFLACQVPGYDLERDMKESPGTLRTYRGYLKFLERDLAGSNVMNGPDGKSLSRNAQDKARRVIAKQMLRNGAQFSYLAELKFPTCVRLSVHPHSNAGPKFAFDMFPGLDMAASPWHNVVMEKADGGLTMGHHASFDPASHETIYRNGYPYYLREKSADRNLGTGITVSPAFPYGVTVEAAVSEDGSTSIKLEVLPMDKIRSLASKYSLIILKGFQVTKDELQVKITEVPIMGSNAPSLQPIERHDGHSSASGTLQVIHCVKSLPHSIVNFTNTAMMLQRALTPEQVDSLSKRSWVASSPEEGSDRSAIVVESANSHRQVLRYPSNCPSATQAIISGLSAEESNGVYAQMLAALTDRRLCYSHKLETGDVIIYDSQEVIRSQFQGSYQGEELFSAIVY